VDPVYFDNVYYIGPRQRGEKPYRFLADALESSGRLALAQMVSRGKEELVLIRPNQKGLVLHTMYTKPLRTSRRHLVQRITTLISMKFWTALIGADPRRRAAVVPARARTQRNIKSSTTPISSSFQWVCIFGGTRDHRFQRLTELFDEQVGDCRGTNLQPWRGRPPRETTESLSTFPTCRNLASARARKKTAKRNPQQQFARLQMGAERCSAGMFTG
jgi:hypothetical protein